MHWAHHYWKQIPTHYSPFLVLVADEKLVELLPLELELVLGVLLDGLLVSDGVVLGPQERLEGHHGGLAAVVAPVSPAAGVAAPATAAAPRPMATAEAAVGPVAVVVPEVAAAAVMIVPLIQ